MSAPLWPDLIPQFQPWISEIRGKLVPNQPLSELTWFRVAEGSFDNFVASMSAVGR